MKNLELEVEYSKEDGVLIIISASISEADLVIKGVSFFDFWDSFSYGQMEDKTVKITEAECKEFSKILENEDELKKYLINNYDL